MVMWLPLGKHSVWWDVMSLTAAASLIEMAVTGKGTTVGRGTTSQWRVAQSLRPIFGVIGLGLLVFVIVDFMKRF
jgi:hypothetical protein